MMTRESGTPALPQMPGISPEQGTGTSPGSRYALRVSLGYAAVAALWMVLTDLLPLALRDAAGARASAAEDLLFLILTAGMLYLALLKYPAPASSLLPTALPRQGMARRDCRAYGFAAVAAAAMSVLAQFRAESAVDPHLPGLMMMPVVLGAFLGGIGPGATATAIGAAAIAAMGLPHGPFAAGGVPDHLWFALLLFVATGLLVSLLSELQIRARQGTREALEIARAQIRSRRETEESLRLVQAAFEQSHEGMVITATDGTILRVNPATCLISGYSTDELLGANMRLVKSGRHDAEFYRTLFKAVEMQGYWQGEIWNKRKSGELYPQWLTVTAVRSDLGRMTHYVGTFTDISIIKQSESRLDHIAHHDALTDLPNRLMLASRLGHVAGHARREAGHAAALMIDLDHFRTVNDSLGHGAGDELLQIAVTRMLGRVRQCDMVARIGGDEFMVVLESLDDPLRAGTVAVALIEELSEPFVLSGGQDVFVGASIGICVIPEDGTDPRDILRNADAALHEAKAAGRGTYRFYRPALTELAHERLKLESSLRRALSHHEFVMHYQPLASMTDRRIKGVEALIRWADPARGMIPPSRFIPLAEETGMIVEMGEWILRTACRQMTSWLAEGSEIEMVAVNLSPRQFRHPDLVEMVRGVLDQTGLPARHLELEITEGALMDGGDETVAKLTQLKELGVRLAIDDFGTGYSSLSYLKRFPVDKLKVDQAFVRGIPDNRTDCEIVAAVIALGKALGLEVLAEGIETEAQYGYLKALDCDTAQGYLLGRPSALAKPQPA